jgi:large subunit ribosomal protein L19
MQKVISPVHSDTRAKLGIRPGDTVRVEQKIIEFKRGKGTDKKEKITKTARTQAFEGLVLAVKHGTEAGGSFTVRAVLSGVGVEKVFPLYSPSIDSIEIVRRSKVRRAKLYFIRDKAAKEVKKQLRNTRRVSITEEVVPVEIAPTAEDVAVAVAESAVAE